MAAAFTSVWYERSLGIRLAGLITGAVATLAAILLAYRSPNPSLVGPFAAALVAGVAIWMLTTARTHVALAVFMLYLGLIDGVIKMMTMSSAATLGRDFLFYAIVVGLIVKKILRREPFIPPPLSGWIAAFVVVVAVQLFNPGDVSFTHALASTRPHVEFVPLFFLGYNLMRSRRRLKAFLVLLLIAGAANGVVSVIQFGLSPTQFASWGPGYSARINGTNGVSGREFVDSSGGHHVRPFGLGDDIGWGGALADLAGPAALALLALGKNRRLKLAAGSMSVGVVLAIVTSQARLAIIASFVAILAYLVLATSSRRALRVLFGLSAGLVIAYAAISILSASTNSHLFERYKSITPAKVFSTSYSYRATTAAEVPKYFVKYPLGSGIGNVGPAAGQAGGTGNTGIDAESEPTFLLSELGIPGLVLLLGFQLRVLRLSARIRRITDVELRILLSALAGPLFAILVGGWDAITTASTPDSPYLWFVAGVLSYWLIGRRQEDHANATIASSPPDPAAAR